MSAVVLVLVALYALLEIAVASALATVIGWGWVLVVVAALGVIGIAVMRNAGMAAARALGAAPGPAGRPTPGAGAAVGDASLRFVAGGLIAFPGLVTSAFGLLLLIPPVRRLLGAAVVGWFVTRLRRGGMSVVTSYDVGGTRVTRVVPGDVIPGEVVPDPQPRTPERPNDPPALPR